VQKKLSVKIIYLYLSSFVALIFFLFGSIATVRDSVELAIGTSYHQTYSQFRTKFDGKTEKKVLREDTPELKQAYQEEVNQSKNRETKRTIQDLAGSSTTFVLGLFFWLFFWKLAKKEN
jgi:hypothetical protein